MREDFACIILSHGRADKVYTVKSLREQGYTGKIYIVCDNEDDTVDDYKKLYGSENVIVFDKSQVMQWCDTMDNYEKHNIVLYARNSCFNIAKILGLSFFLELDDDYQSFAFRVPNHGKLSAIKCKDLDRLFTDMVDFLVASDSLVAALSQGGDYIGGANAKPFYFFGTINEDTNMYITLGSRGEKIFSVTNASLNQIETQKQSGGLTEIYLDVGTYVKSFYSVMTMPSAAKVAPMGSSHKRMHHLIDWKCCVPMILNEKYRNHA